MPILTHCQDLPTVADLQAWLASLPPEYRTASIASIVGGAPSSAKRVIAATYKDGSGRLVIINSLGTHYSDEWAADVDFTDVLS